MKAVFIERLGGPEVLRYDELPDPEPGPGEAVIDVAAASVNAADAKVRRGIGLYPITRFPHVLGRDFSGTVAALGEGVGGLAPGDAVYGACEQAHEGAYAEKVAVKADLVAPKPRSLSHVEAAAIALTGLTAVAAIERTLSLARGERILITGGAGRVAGFAIQLAKHIGAHVVTTASPANHPYVLGLGADEVIDYHTVDFAKIVSGCDAAFDTVGGDVAAKCYDVLRSGGRAAFIAGPPPTPPRADLTGRRPDVVRGRVFLERVTGIVEAGIVRMPNIEVFTFANTAAAHRISEARHLRGKLVLVPR